MQGQITAKLTKDRNEKAILDLSIPLPHKR